MIYRSVLALLLAIFILVLTGCDKGGPLIVSEIQGPSTISENVAVTFTILAEKDTGIMYNWAVDPPTSGTFSQQNSSTTQFTASETDADFSVVIKVLVNSDNDSVVSRTKEITIVDAGSEDPPDDPKIPMNPNIPIPFQYFTGQILDIAIEGDNDVVLATESGLQLYTPYGVMKRTLSHSIYVGLVTSNSGSLDTGRGVMGISPDNMCIPTPSYDDQYVQGGVPHVSYNVAWWNGEPDPYYPDVPVNIASTSSFSSCSETPHGIAYHPTGAYAVQKVYAPNCIADSDMQWPVTNNISHSQPGHALLMYHPDAPLPPDYMSHIFQGGVDFIVYYDYPTYMEMQYMAAFYGVMPACSIHSLFIIWDITDSNFMSERDGMVAGSIADFEFDSQNRLIMAMPGSGAIAITEPVVFGEPIIVDKIIGGRQDGMGTLPGEFRNPTAIAIDPRNEAIVVSDTGNDRIQIFDNAGNFVREFGGTDEFGGDIDTFTPGAVRVDASGTIFVANVNPLRTPGDDLRLFDEYGHPAGYGTIEGHVYDVDTGIPIDNVMVRTAAAQSGFEALTNYEGFFIFPAILNGVYTLVFEKYSYDSHIKTVGVAPGYKTVVEVNMERVFVDPGYGHVSGTVVSSINGEVVPGLQVEIVDLPISNTTNDDGEFTLYMVPEGEQLLRITGNSVIYYEKYITVTAGGIVDMGFIYLPIPE